nr:unnamed protein product [Digitaria exilis]
MALRAACSDRSGYISFGARNGTLPAPARDHNHVRTHGTLFLR